MSLSKKREENVNLQDGVNRELSRMNQNAANQRVLLWKGGGRDLSVLQSFGRPLKFAVQFNEYTKEAVYKYPCQYLSYNTV